MTWFDDQTDARQRVLCAKLEDSRAAAVNERAKGDTGFACWLLVAQAACKLRRGFSIFDLADAPWENWYRDGVAPEEALEMELQAERLVL